MNLNPLLVNLIESIDYLNERSVRLWLPLSNALNKPRAWV